MELQSPPLCPPTVTVRRNPHRKARQAQPVIPFVDPESEPAVPAKTTENLRVYLRIRPPEVAARGSLACGGGKTKKTKTKVGEESCLVATDPHSVVLSPPASIRETKRLKQEVFEGFGRVFATDSPQEEIYVSLMEPMVENFLRGNNVLLVAMGPTGSGKTHTVFGTPREPGLVPRALNRLFGLNGASDLSGPERSYFISMFEIYSDKGRSEKPIDLLSSGGDLQIQESTLKGHRKAKVSNVTEAQCVIAQGLLRRTTAETNSNHKSSRSQCVISIYSAPGIGAYAGDSSCTNAALTIVDLAGAERESKTGNQGARLLESNFINNTSMVFGQCLRSLLEHQKNPKRPLQKLYHYSLLTKYLRGYLEGKKQMTLILTVKPGAMDYYETSFLLRQASPFMSIKYSKAGDSSDMPNLKRQASILIRTEKLKRRKCPEIEASTAREKPPVMSEEQPKVQDNQHVDLYKELLKEKRQNLVTLGFLQAMWKILKEYKQKLQESNNEDEHLKVSINKEKSLNAALKKELIDVKSCLMNHGRKLEEVCSDLVLVEENISRTMSSHAELENNCEDLHILSPNAEEQEIPSHSEASEGSVNKRLGDDNMRVPSTFTAVESVLPMDNLQSVARHDVGFPFASVESLESSAIENSCSKRGQIDDEPDNRGCEAPTIVLSHQMKAQRTRKLAPVSAVLWKEMSGFGIEEEGAKSNRSKKKNVDVRLQTRGSETLVRMLRNNLRL